MTYASLEDLLPAPDISSAVRSTEHPAAGIDLGTLADHLGRIWAQHPQTAVVGASTVLAALLATIAWRFVRSPRKDRWIDRIAAGLVLAWTSEGMWEVATQTLELPAPFAVATFFVVEAMLLSSAMRASQHRKAKGVPGPSGTLVWVLAAVFGTVVAMAATSLVEFLLRIALPLAAVGLWWTGLTAERPDDTAEMRTERQRRAEARDATWAVTPRTLLVRWGVLKPGRTTTTEAQREHQVRRMVILADKAATGSRHARAWRVRRLRALTRTADQAMVAEVAERVDRARRAEQLMVLPAVNAPGDDRTLADDSDDRHTRPATRPATRPDITSVTGADNRPVTADRTEPARSDIPDTSSDRPSPGAGVRPAWPQPPRRRKPTALDRARAVLDEWQREGREITGEALAAELGDISARTGRRVIDLWQKEGPAATADLRPESADVRPPVPDSRPSDRTLTSVR